jgi:hypothetical protein
MQPGAPRGTVICRSRLRAFLVTITDPAPVDVLVKRKSTAPSGATVPA